MSSRRSHPKSHHGCLQCKQRRVKCDETRPQCGSCRKRLVICSLQNDLSSTPYSPGAGELSPQPTPSSRLPFLELELLNHWHTATSFSLDTAENIDISMRKVISVLAISRPFLMHGVLATSAFHILQTCPPNKQSLYADTAMKHKLLAVSQFAPLLDNITEENCNSLYAFSSLVPMLSFAAQISDVTRTSTTVVDVVEVFKLIMGVAAVVTQAREWIEKGELAPLLRRNRFQIFLNASQPSSEIRLRLHALVDFCQRTSKDDQVLSIQLLAIHKLLELYDACIAFSDGVVVLAWPVAAGSQFLDLLLESDPVSLVILAYYGVIFDELENVWYLKGYGRLLVSIAVNSLDDSWQSAIRWPLEITTDTATRALLSPGVSTKSYDHYEL
ncbi:C6 zinc finger domain protein [Xylogone sp. PMI_703]|nr:C6 zinc finger domain protein [Xylogone sp. PMI_703]